MENVVVHIISHSHWDRGVTFCKVTGCNWWNFLTIFLICLNDPEFRAFTWMAKPLSLMIVGSGREP